MKGDREEKREEKGLGISFFDSLSAWAPLVASGKESACQCRRQGFEPWVGKIPWRSN